MPPLIATVAALIFAVTPVGVTLATATAIAAGLVIGTAVIAGSIIMSVLLKPKTASNAASDTRLNQQLDPNAYRKIILGQTAAGNDEIYWEVWGSKFTNYDQVIALASHTITAFVQLYMEGNPVNFSGANAIAVTGYSPSYAGALQSYTTLKGTTGSNAFGTTVGSGSYWGSTGSMTGLAGRLLKWTYTQKKLPAGLPSRVCDVIKGSPVYDPRKDSTQGGSGSHRANDNTTWQYTPTDSNGIEIGRNNALQMLRYLLGWSIAGITVDGRGVNPADIDYASFITAANVCETQQYYTDCILSTGDTHSNNEGIIANGAQGVVLDSGGLWSYHPAYNDTASIAVAFTQDDIVSAVQWNPKASMPNIYNQISGTFIDPSTTSLYVAAPYPFISNSTYITQDNGYENMMTLDFQNVQSAALAQKLAQIALNKTRLTGTLQATFNFKALQANNYDCVTLTLPYLGWTTKLFRITSMSINPTGGIDLTLVEDDPSVYTGGTINTYTPAAAAPAYNRAQQVDIGGFSLNTVEVSSLAITYAYDGINVNWAQTPANVAQVEFQYAANLVPNPFGFNSWGFNNCTAVTSLSDPFSGTGAVAIQLSVSNANDYAFIEMYTGDPSNQTWIGGFWYKASTLSGNVSLTLVDGAFAGNRGSVTVTPTSTWQYAEVTYTFTAGSTRGAFIVVDPSNDTTGTAGQQTLFYGVWAAPINSFQQIPLMTADRTGFIIPNVVPATSYVVRGRTITVNGVAGNWDGNVIITNTYSTPTNTPTFSQTTDPTTGGVIIPINAIWSVPNGPSYLMTATGWTLLAAAPASGAGTLADGTILYSSPPTGGAFSVTIPANALSHVWIEGWGAGGEGYANGSTLKGGASGAYFKTYVAVTPGTTVIAGTAGLTGGLPANSGTGASGGDTVATGYATAHGGLGATSSSPGAGQSATGGSLINTTGNSGSGASGGAAIVSGVDSAAYGAGGVGSLGTSASLPFGGGFTIPPPPAGFGYLRITTKT